MVSLPAPAAGFVASAEEVARRVGLDPDTLTDAQETAILDRLLDAQGKVESALNRDSLLPVRRTFAGQWPDVSWELTAWRAWPGVADLVDDDFTVVSSTADVDGAGSYTVVVDAGIDARVITAIRSWVVRDAAEALRYDPDLQMGSRVVTSVSAEGQSLSFAAGGSSGAADAPGGAPSLASLRRWRRPVVYARPTPEVQMWPYGGPVTIG